jgi:predicted nucleic acid-binding protein
MGDGKIGAVSDAGPLVHLAEIDHLPLLSIFDTLHIPNAVWQETVGQGRVSETSLLTLANVKRHTLVKKDAARFVRESGFEKLHAGERECLYLCRQLKVPTLLTDDLAVREAAHALAIQPVGSLGIVVRACLEERIPQAEAEQCMFALYDVSSLYITRTIVDMAIEQLHSSITGES